MKRFLTLLSIILVLVFVGLIVSPSFVDMNQYKAQITQKIEEVSGYNVALNGDIQLALLPMPKAQIENIVVRSRSGDENPLLQLDRADVSVNLAPLFSKKVEVNNITLVKPVIYVAKDADGTFSYMSEKLKASASTATDDDKKTQETQSQSSPQSPVDLSFDKITIEKGTLEYFDAANKTTQMVENINLDIAAQSIKGPFALTGDVLYQNISLILNGKTIDALKSDGSLPVQVNVSVGDSGADVAFSGVIDTAAQEAQGKLQLDVQNATKLLKALNMPTNAAFPKALDFKGDVLASADSVAFNNLEADIDGVLAKGAASVSGFKGKKPKFTAQISSDNITKLNPYVKTAVVNVNGVMDGSTITLSKSLVKLDDTSASVSGSYKGVKGGRGYVSLDVSADKINFDQFMPQKTQKEQAGQQNSNAKPADLEKALEPVKGLSLPFDADFDISIQSATLQQKTINGIRMQGVLKGQKLTLKQAGVNDYMGVAANVKGSVTDIATLSGVDMNAFIDTKNLRQTMQDFALDTSKLPANIGAASVSVATKGDMNNLNFNADVKAIGGKVSAKGSAQSVLKNMQLSNIEAGLSHPNFVQAMQAISPNFKGGQGLAQKIDMNAKIDQDGKTYKLSNITGSYGGMAINGAVVANLSAKPKINGDISLGNVPLDTFLGSEQAKAARNAKSSGGAVSSSSSQKQRWSTRTIDVNWINAADINFDVSAKSVNYGGWALTNPKTKIDMSGGQLAIENLTAGLFGGSATVDAQIKPRNGGGVDVTGQSSMKNVSLEALIYALSNSKKLKATGDASLTMQIAAGGQSANTLVNSVGGNAKLDGQNIVMEGFDLGKLARSLSADIKPGDSVQALMGGVRGGTTKIDTIDGQYDIQNGIVAISSMIMDGPSASIASKGNVSLPKWYIDTTHTITLKDASDDVPAFDIAIKGALDNPGNTFGTGIMRDFLQRKIERKLAKEAEKFLGDKVDGELGNALKKLGILGSSNNDSKPQNETPAAGQTTDPAPVQERPQQKQEEASPEEKIIRGVLDGLLR